MQIQEANVSEGLRSINIEEQISKEDFLYLNYFSAPGSWRGWGRRTCSVRGLIGRRCRRRRCCSCGVLKRRRCLEVDKHVEREKGKLSQFGVS